MGYKPNRTVYELEFAKEGFEGLVVKAYGVPLGQFLDMVQLADQAEMDASKLGAKAARSVLEMLTSFASVLVEWNVENDDDTPVPATLDGLRTQEFPFVLTIIQAWMGAAAGVSAPLEQGQNSTQPSAMALIPMETLSASQAS